MNGRSPAVAHGERGPTWAWRWFLATIGVATLAYFFLPIGVQSILYDVVAVAAAAAMFAGIAWNLPEPRFAWTLLALGVLLWAGGDIVFGTSQPVPSLADMFYISAYPLLALGLVGLARTTAGGRNESTLTDAVVVAAGVGVVTMVFLVVPAGQTRGVTLAARVVSLGYPLMDLGLLAILVRPARAAVARRGVFGLLGTALVLRVVADTGYALMNFGTTYTVGNAADAAWLLSYACFGAAVLHPLLGDRDVPAPAGSSAGVSAVAGQPQARVGAVVIAPTQVVRLRVVLAWAGLMLLVLSGSALLMAASWRAPDVMFLAGAYGTTGSLMLIASSIRS